jgi:small subunit ribosomal protein S8
MLINDPIADMFTRIRNGLGVQTDIVEVPHSRIKERIAEILAEEGFIEGFEIGKAGSFRSLFLKLKYGGDRKPVINEIKRVSKPGRRIYVQKDAVPRVTNGFGIAILSTSKGVMTYGKARKAGVGGELIATVW